MSEAPSCPAPPAQIPACARERPTPEGSAQRDLSRHASLSPTHPQKQNTFSGGETSQIASLPPLPPPGGRQPLFQTGPVSPTLLRSLISFTFCAHPSQEDKHPPPSQTNSNNRETDGGGGEAYRATHSPPIALDLPTLQGHRCRSSPRQTLKASGRSPSLPPSPPPFEGGAATRPEE